MSVSDSLTEALRDRYLVEHELGRGGMATVYLARDLKHDRLVAIKVLNPDLTAVLGPERFLREVRVTAGLRHPHILPLLDSGTAAGSLYYIMPYIDGESLRERLRREGKLPIADALNITCDVASALDYAHGRGVIHRDIKPENILLYQGEPMVADFGIALVGDQPSAERLTQTGLSLGTPHYMSPEQVVGDLPIDGRTDQYALACVVYEMLAGEPPFKGPTPQAVIAKRFSEPIPHVAERREVPLVMDEALQRALARGPQDRFPTAGAFAAALEARPEPQHSTGAGLGQTVLGRKRILAFAAGIGLAAAIPFGWWLMRRTAGPPVDPNLVAVIPFRVAGADQSLHYLREGMLDLLAAKLTGESGPIAADPRAVVNVWRASVGPPDHDLPVGRTLALGQRLGAGQVLLGDVVGTRARIVLHARTLAVPGGRQLAQASVEGPTDSLAALIDRLTSQLLAVGAGQADQRLAELTSTSLPAVRAYLTAQAAYRRGAFALANQRFNQALDRDSAFTLAALGLAATELWMGTVSHRTRRAIWAGRDRLGPRDRALAIASVGPRYPAATPLAEDLAAWLQAVAAAPDRPEAWFHTGDRYFHFGAVLGIADADRQAAAHFRRALELDPQGEAPLAHLVELAALRGDSAQAGRLGERFLATDSAGDVADFLRWRVAVVRRDSAALARVRARFPRTSVGSLLRIVQASQEMGQALEDADGAAEELRRRSGTPAEREQISLSLASLALNRGRPSQHLEITEALHRLDPTAREYLRLRASGALFAGGDTAAARRAIAALATFADGPQASGAAARFEQNRDICLVELWRLEGGDLRTVDRAIARLRTPVVASDSGPATLIGAVCARLLGAKVAVQLRHTDASLALRMLDSALLTAGPMPSGISENLIAARLHALSGDLQGALAAVRRRARWTTLPADYLAGYTREEGRLAAALGDRSGAIRAYRHYLALRSMPEPPIAPEVAQVRDELGKLLERTEVARP